ncbi:MAG TPA: hypothetical protein PLD32_12495 [Saprospiraceae bacterium]|nr:hypothetical protein [Saprospiraceae bacterium]HNG70112.1 hypothetical protein [Saprospiraceae bacterium]
MKKTRVQMVIDLLDHTPMTVAEIADKLNLRTDVTGVALRNAMKVRGEVVQDAKRDGYVTWRLRNETDTKKVERPKNYGVSKMVVLPKKYWDKVTDIGDGQIKRGLIRLIENA